MQLTRAVITIALAASAANALPRSKPGDCANAQDRQQATPGNALDGIDKRSHILPSPHLKLGFGAGAGTEGDSGLRQNTQKETMGQLESVGADEARASANVQNINRLLSNCGKEAGRTIERMNTFKLLDSTQSSAFQKKPHVQRGYLERELQDTMGMSNNADVPVLDTNALTPEKAHTATQTRNVDQDKQSATNTGLTLDVREPSSSLAQNRAYGKIFSSDLHAHLMSQQSTTDQRQVSDGSSSARADMEYHNDMSQQESQVLDAQLQHSNSEAAQSHTDMPATSVSSYQEDLANNKMQTVGHYDDQEMQQNQQQM